MLDIASLTRTFGYPAVILGTMLQGEAVLLVCGFLAHQGYLSPWGVWLVAALSATTGDLTYFTLGRHFGDRLVRRLPAGIRRPVQWAKRFVDRHPNRVLLFMRFFFGTRVIMPIVCGMSSIRLPKFLSYNLPTALLWAGIFVGAGYLFGVAARQVLRDVESAELYLILALIAAAIVYHIIGKRRQSRNDDASSES